MKKVVSLFVALLLAPALLGLSAPAQSPTVAVSPLATPITVATSGAVQVTGAFAPSNVIFCMIFRTLCKL